MGDATGAAAANRRGVAHLLVGDLDAAASAFGAALAADPDDPSAWFNLSLVHKRRRHWLEVARCSERAAELARGRNEAAWWNAGIAATALHDWARARAAWRRFGFDLEPDGGPVSLPMGPVAVVVAGAPPVHATRVDPARARVTDVPRPESGLAYGDIVLCDAEPLGQLPAPAGTGTGTGTGTIRIVAALERWRASGIPTITARVGCAAPEDREALLDAAVAAGLGATDRTEDGRTDAETAGWDPSRVLLLAGDPTTAHRTLDGWRVARPGARTVHDADVTETLVAAPGLAPAGPTTGTRRVPPG